MCDLILFMTKMSPIPGLENKKVSVDVSYLDTSSNTLIVATTDAGIIESILGKNKLTFKVLYSVISQHYLQTLSCPLRGDCRWWAGWRAPLASCPP